MTKQTELNELENDIKNRSEVYNKLKGIDTSSQPDRSSVKQLKTKKEFPNTESMFPHNSMDWFGLGKHNPPLLPLVKDENGNIIIAGTRYSRKRQHYPSVIYG